MKDKLVSILLENLYHPVRARLAYDLLIAFSSILFSYLVYSPLNINLFVIFSFPILFAFINLSSGFYDSLKFSPPWQKTLMLSSTSVFTFSVFALLGANIAPLLNAAVYLALLTAIPRLLLNFFNSPIREGTISQVVNSDSPILVVGGGGYIGSVLVEKMLDKNMKVRVFDKFIYGKEVFDDLKSDARLEIFEGDATDLQALTMALQNVKAVVHLAGIVGDPASMVDDRLTRHMNIVSTRMVKEAVKGLRIPRFIFASSCSVYGASDKVIDERGKLNPLSAYAKSKIDSEKELLTDTFDEFHPTILRFATVFGHSRKPRFDLVANLFVAQAYNNGFITVTGESQWRPFIHTQDVADSIIKVLESPLEKVSRQIFNVGDNRLHTTIGELAKTVQRLFEGERNIKITVRNDETDLRNYKVSFKKINGVLGFTCQVDIERGLKEILNKFKSNVYKKPYTDTYYSAFETTKEVKKEFYSKTYQKTHFTELS